MKKKPVWFDLAVELWNQKQPSSVICDAIAVKYGKILDDNDVAYWRKKFNNYFPPKTKEEVGAATAATHLRNRQLKNKHRTLAMKYLAQQERAKKKSNFVMKSSPKE